MFRPLRTCALAGLLLLSSCAWGPGQSNTVLAPSLTVAFDPAGRERPDGWLRLSSDYEVQLEAVGARFAAAEVQALVASGGGGTFDPARPPAGYSCHGGHCHTPDGRNLTYEEVAAELSGGGGLSTVARFGAPDALLDALGGAAALALECEDCVLDPGRTSRAELQLVELQVAGRVRDARSPARFAGERSFAFALPAEHPVLPLTTPLILESDRFGPAELPLTLQVTFSPRTFDLIDWAALSQDDAGHIALDDEANHEVLDAWLDRFSAEALTTDLAPQGDEP